MILTTIAIVVFVALYVVVGALAHASRVDDAQRFPPSKSSTLVKPERRMNAYD